jgi:hypothetical protein
MKATQTTTTISDFGPHCVNVNVTEWPTETSTPELHAIASKTGKEFVSTRYPHLSFKEETGLLGHYGGALIYGVVHTFRVY